MKTWLRWFILILTIGGGFAGAAVTVQVLFQPTTTGLINIALCCGFLALYLFTILSGLLFADNPRRTIPIIVALILQIPWVSSPILSYSFSAGSRLTVAFVGGDFRLSYLFGSDWQVFILQNKPWGVGLNLFALVVLLVLLWYTWKSRNPVEQGAVSKSTLAQK
jgi:hypothetical protein